MSELPFRGDDWRIAHPPGFSTELLEQQWDILSSESTTLDFVAQGMPDMAKMCCIFQIASGK